MSFSHAEQIGHLSTLTTSWVAMAHWNVFRSKAPSTNKVSQRHEIIPYCPALNINTIKRTRKIAFRSNGVGAWLFGRVFSRYKSSNTCQLLAAYQPQIPIRLLDHKSNRFNMFNQRQVCSGEISSRSL